MSRVAKASIEIPSNVQCTLNMPVVVVKGPKGELTESFTTGVDILVEQGAGASSTGMLHFKPANADVGWAHAGTARAIICNMIMGVTQGFQKTLELVGVGYRVQIAGKKITLSLGYSHPIEYHLPKTVDAEAPNNTTLILKGIDKQLIGQIAADIRAYRPPEPYKGKGIKYAGEVIRRKEAKKK